MKVFVNLICAVALVQFSYAQVSSKYIISFENAVHHEAEIEVIFKNIKSDTATFRMSRTSPGRYALHEFVKNVYNVKVSELNGNELKTFRSDPYSWHIADHKGEFKITYTLFANHGDGTYAQIDETHAHLNMPATFMYLEGLENDEYEIEFVPRDDLNWKISTQLKHLGDNKYYAHDLQYFLDSPTELSNHRISSFNIGEGKQMQTINIALHDTQASESDFAQYTQYVEEIVNQQIAVYGEAPKFDYGNFTFLACFMPQVDGDAMEHRNSTYLTTTTSLAKSGGSGNLGSAAHEFFHVWNVERIRPQSLEPFDFAAADMSGELWFAEGFTNYYTRLSMLRAGVISEDIFLNGLQNTFNFVWNAPGREYFNPIEMSYQAPFVDAATSVDPNNKNNTFISYYDYGDMLGLALDLMLRERNKSLDDYMKLVWNKLGKPFKPYTIVDLHKLLEQYSDKNFANNYFENYIYKSGMPNFEPLFANVGVDIKKIEEAGFGATLKNSALNILPNKHSTAYKAGLQEGDKIISVDDITITDEKQITSILNTRGIGQKITLIYERYGILNEVEVEIQPKISYSISFINEELLTKNQRENRALWLNKK